jgi:hypothetical protein
MIIEPSRAIGGLIKGLYSIDIFREVNGTKMGTYCVVVLYLITRRQR